MKQEQETGLPDEWKWVNVGDIAQLYRGITYTKTDATNYSAIGSAPLLRGNNINQELNFEDLVYVPKDLIKPEQFLQKGDIVFAMSSGSKHLVGKSAYVREDFEGSFGAFCGLLRVLKGTDPKFVSYIFKTNRYRNHISEISKGTNINNLKREHLLDFGIPIPPLPTQQAIVTKLEALLQDLDAGIAHLKKAQEQLKLYRQAVLKWAFEGRLTNEHVVDGELPEGWKWVRLGEVCESVRNGVSPKPIDDGKFKVLRISAVRPNKINFWDFRNLEMEPDVSYRLIENDLLFTRYNGSVDYLGVCGRVPELTETFYYPDKLIRCRLKNPSEAFSKYVQFATNFGKSRQFILSRIKTTAGQTGISGSDLKDIPLVLPSLATISRIVVEVESRFSKVDLIESALLKEIDQGELLRQSILKSAFVGKLS